MRPLFPLLLVVLIGFFIFGWIWIGRNPRDSILRRTIKQLILLIALLMIGLSIGTRFARQSAQPESPEVPAARSDRLAGSYHLRYVGTPSAALFADLGLDAHRFQISAPPDARVSVWIETYERGQLRPDLSWGYYRSPRPGERIRGQGRFTMFNPAALSAEESPRAKWTLAFDGVSGDRWIEEPFRQYDTRGFAHRDDISDLQLNKTYLLFSIYANESNVAYTGTERQLRENDLLVMVKCRLTPLDPQRENINMSGALDAIPP